MTDQTPLNPDALARHQWAHDFNSCDCGKSIPTIIDSENCVYVPNDKAMAMHQIEMATVAQPEGWEQQAKNFMRVIDRLTAENEALKAVKQRADSDAGWLENMDRQGGA